MFAQQPPHMSSQSMSLATALQKLHLTSNNSGTVLCSRKVHQAPSLLHNSMLRQLHQPVVDGKGEKAH
jgi:hypothetical protein